MNRREARKHAFSLIYQLPFHTDFEADAAFECYIYQLAADNPEMDIDSIQREYIKTTLSGVCSHIDEIDGLIKKNLHGWEIDRISKVDLAILRLCIYEVRFIEEIPDKVSINEAVVLAKEYGTDDSKSFVNGVLASVSRDISSGAGE